MLADAYQDNPTDNLPIYWLAELDMPAEILNGSASVVPGAFTKNIDPAKFKPIAFS